MKQNLNIGVISDTHGLIRPEVVEFLKDSDLILHAGDIGGTQVLQELETLAPVKVVKGNCDSGVWSQQLQETELIDIDGFYIGMIHDLELLDFDPVATGAGCLVSGHTHQPRHFEKEGILYINPGSAGPQRYGKPIGIGRLTLGEGGLTYKGFELIGKSFLCRSECSRSGPLKVRANRLQ